MPGRMSQVCSFFRYEPLDVARRIVAPNNPLLRRGGPVPIVYRFNLKNGSTLLAMQTFDVQSRDIIYISNASSIDIQKFMGLFQGVTGTAYRLPQSASPRPRQTEDNERSNAKAGNGRSPLYRKLHDVARPAESVADILDRERYDEFFGTATSS